MLDVTLTGGLQIELVNGTRVAGTIGLAEGELRVQGKPFTIEEGDVTFTGRPPGNPLVVASAKWTGPEGTDVFAEFAGPVKSGKLTLRSNPPLPKDEILSLIVFGTADSPLVSDRSGSTTGTAAGVGGSLVAEGLNEAIRDLTDIELTARVGAASTGADAAQVELAIARNLSLVYSYILGLPPPGQNPDRNYATIEWRFRHKWSLETTVGDQGSTSVDVLWENRY